jgi:hypothetical protein
MVDVASQQQLTHRREGGGGAQLDGLNGDWGQWHCYGQGAIAPLRSTCREKKVSVAVGTERRRQCGELLPVRVETARQGRAAALTGFILVSGSDHCDAWRQEANGL